jgi:hypothetical protein
MNLKCKELPPRQSTTGLDEEPLSNEHEGVDEEF